VADGRVGWSRAFASAAAPRRGRAVLVIPHYIVLSIWNLVVVPAVAVAWLIF
jgi:hypothetical protein